ncbi:MAG UNVERIFIED_CONTAM: hypothetical protein LVT10_13320 [Anaerolineae bacterium]
MNLMLTATVLTMLPGPRPDFWTHFAAACKDVKPDCFLFGEIIDTPEAQHAYVGRVRSMPRLLHQREFAQDIRMEVAVACRL